MSLPTQAFSESVKTSPPGGFANRQIRVDQEADNFRKQVAAILARMPFNLMFAESRLRKTADGEYRIVNSCPSLQNEEGKTIDISKISDDENINGFIVATGPDGAKVMLHVKGNRLINLVQPDGTVDRDVLYACFERLEQAPVMQPTRRNINHATASQTEKYDATTGRDRLLDYMREQGRRMG